MRAVGSEVQPGRKAGGEQEGTVGTVWGTDSGAGRWGERPVPVGSGGSEPLSAEERHGGRDVFLGPECQGWFGNGSWNFDQPPNCWPVEIKSEL